MQSFMTRHFRRLPVIIATTALLSAVATTAIASQVLTIVAAEGGANRGAQVKSQNSISTTTSTTPVDVPGAFVTFTVRTGESWLILSRWTGEMGCTGAVNGSCFAKILLDGVEMNPADTTFNSPIIHTSDTSNSTANLQGHSMERFRDNLPAGTHTLQVQYWVSNSAIQFWADDWTLSVMAWRAI